MPDSVCDSVEVEVSEYEADVVSVLLVVNDIVIDAD